jgi:PAS domain S-box-containing protein
VAAATALDLQLVAEALPFLAWTADAQGSVVFVNKRWVQSTGIDAAAARGRGWTQAIDPFVRAGVEMALDEAFASQRPTIFETLLVTSLEVQRWIRVRCIPIKDASGELAAWLGTMTDIDDERRTADRLRISASANAALAQTSGLDATLATLTKTVVPELADWAMISLLEGESAMRVARIEHRDAIRSATVGTNVMHAVMRLHGGDNAEVVRWAEPRVYPQLDFADVAPQMRDNGLPESVIDAFGSLGFRSAIFLPLMHRGRPIGVLQAVRSEIDSGSYDGRDVPLFTDLASAAANAIANAQIFDALLDSERHLAVVSRASDELARSLSLHETYETFARIVVPELADWVSIVVRDQGTLRTVAGMHVDPMRADVAAGLIGPYRGDLDATGGTAAVIRSGRPEVWTLIDDSLLARFMHAAGASIYNDLGLRSTVIVPLLVDGETFGALVVGSTSFHRLFTPQDLPLFQELAHRASAAISNARRYEQEHRVATALQAGALPKSLPDAFGYVFSGHYAPGRTELQIGGDWYDALRLADGRIVISIGDVLGSGLDAAVTMGNLRQIIRGVAQVHPDPALMLDAADKTLRADLDRPDRIVTALVGVLDPITATLTYASAGHPPAILRTADGSIEELRTTGLPLGLRERDESVTRTVTIPPGALLVFYTDGLTESTRDIIEGERRLLTALLNPAILAAKNIARALHDDVLFDGSHDDVAILAVRAPQSGGGDPLVRWSFSSDDGERASSARHEFSELLTQRSASEDERFIAELVFGELIGNVVRYAPGPVDVAVDLSGASPVLHVLDGGEGFHYVPKLPDDLLSERGRGLFIVTTMTAEFSVVARPVAGSHARAVLNLTK